MAQPHICICGATYSSHAAVAACHQSHDVEEFNRLKATNDDLVKALEGLHEAIALGPLDAAAKYGPDFDPQANLEHWGRVAVAALAQARAPA